MESSDAEEAWCIAGMHHVVLHTIGRKSGNEHKVALPYWVDRDGHASSSRRSPVRRTTRPGTST